MFEIYFLWAIAIVWLIFASIEDLRTSEISNWLNYSLIIFALGFRFFYSLFELGDFSFFYHGLIGVGIFFILSNLFYYGKLFAGGDYRVLVALGAILPIYNNFYLNLELFLVFILFFLFVGAIYGIFVSVYFGFRNFGNLKKELKKQIKLNKSYLDFILVFSGILFFLEFLIDGLVYFGIFVLFMFYFYLYVKSIDESCMVRRVKPSKLTEGDWLYEDVRIGKKIVHATWDGLSREDISLLKKKKDVLVRYGIRFAPVFLISFVLTIIGLKNNFFGFLF